MATNPIDRITQLLDDDAPERRIAAAIVLGHLKAKGPKVTQGLLSMLDDDAGPLLQQHALEALGAIGPQKVANQILPLVGSRHREVQNAAARALLAAGDSIVTAVRSRIADADHGERKALEAVLAQLGGKEAFTALLDSLDECEEAEARAAAVAMRERAKGADGKQRRSYLAQLQKFLTRKNRPAWSVSAALKILGYLEDPRAADTLLAFARDTKQPASVRQEALIALRFLFAAQKPDTKLVNALVKAAEDEDRALAQTALMTLAGIQLPNGAAARLETLLEHPDVERAGFVIDLLKNRDDSHAAALLVKAIDAPDLRRAEYAAKALAGRKDAGPVLVDSLVRATNEDRARLIRGTLRSMGVELAAAQRKKLLEAGLARLEKEAQSWNAQLDLAREVDPKGTATALRKLALDYKRRRKTDRAVDVLKSLCRTEQATDDDRFVLASLLLRDSRKDTRRAARHGDDALKTIEMLIRHGYDVLGALRRDRNVGLDEFYYLGFHFVEEEEPIGEDLLNEVIAKGGRKKIAKMAKNKLGLVGLL